MSSFPHSPYAFRDHPALMGHTQRAVTIRAPSKRAVGMNNIHPGLSTVYSMYDFVFLEHSSLLLCFSTPISIPS